MDKKRVLITGASGFIGKNCAKEFIKRGWKVVSLIHKKVSEEFKKFRKNNEMDLIYGDIESREGLIAVLEHYVNKKQIKAVVHCAGRASDIGHNREFQKTNYNGLKNIVECLERFSIDKLIFISTTDVYGIKDFENADETEALENNLKNPYPEYKIKAEAYIRSKLQKNRYVIIRPAAVWGPDDRTILPRVIKYLNSSPFIIHFGKWRGQNRWPLAYIENVSRMIYLAVKDEDALGESFNIIDREKTGIDEYYRMIIDIFIPKRSNIKSVTLPFILGWFAGTISSLISK